jgi:hypothetical protein
VTLKGCPAGCLQHHPIAGAAKFEEWVDTIFADQLFLVSEFATAAKQGSA